MGQEFFGGPEYFTEFDPEKFVRDLKAQAEADKTQDHEDAEPEGDDHGE
ncbi:MAG: hypothetical protein Q4F37_03960 [Corynebacterium sp.]|nr:hypothetical protein [Corynebacterium sp.]